MSIIQKAVLVVAVVVFAAMNATSANNAEQIIFSDTGATMAISGNANPDLTSTPFGFWIWCAGAAAPGSNGGYQNGNACQGNMYFYALQGKATHVVGFATEPSQGIFTMHVMEGTAAQFFSHTLNPEYSCLLTNAVAGAKGPGNTVQVNCMFMAALGGGTGSDTDTGAVVNINGPTP